MRRTCSAHCSVEEGEGKQLNFIQYDAGLLSLLYNTYSVGLVTLQRSLQRRHCWRFWVLGQSSGEGDYGLAGLLLLLYSTYSAGSVTLQRSLQRRHCWLFRVLSQSSGEGDHGLALSSTRTATAHIHSWYCVASFSLSAMEPADLLVLKRVSKSWIGSTSFKAGSQLQSQSGCELGRNIDIQWVFCW